MKVVLFGRSITCIEEMQLALGLRWPRLISMAVDTGEHAAHKVLLESPDLAVVFNDLNEPDMFETILQIRKFSGVPIVSVDCQLDYDDSLAVVRALDNGADDFVRMPCSLMELMARAVALLRRVNMVSSPDDQPISYRDLTILPDAHEAFLGSDEMELTPTEFRLLLYLVRNRGSIVSRDAINNVVWMNEFYTSDTLKKYVQRLRHKLGDDAKNPTWIKTIHGVGYRFV